MNSEKIGKLIQALRQEKGMTQKEVGDAICVSDKTVSKWECGAGCPDITLLSELSRLFSVDIEQLLSGNLEQDAKLGGNMRRLQFFVCPHCGNISTTTGGSAIMCCGRKLEAMPVQKISETDIKHKLEITENGDELFVKLNHEMTKSHFIRFIAWKNFDTLVLKKLYPEQDAIVTFPKVYKGSWYVCCSQHGLFMVE